MREFINKDDYKEIKEKYKDNNKCCYIKLNGKKLKTKEDYYEKLKKKLELNDSFSNNLNAYSDMMRDPYTYGNKQIIVFVIKKYKDFLSEETSKPVFEKIFDKDIIPFFRNEVKATVMKSEYVEIHVYCMD